MSVCVCEPNKFPDNPWLLLKHADECCAGIWKVPKELSDLGCCGWDGSKNSPDGGGKKGGGGGINGLGPRGGGSAVGDGGGEMFIVIIICWFLSVP